MASALIVVRDLVKRYGERIVLDHLDLSIQRGETVAIIGGSGSGKSTLARILIGLEEPTSGCIAVDGIVVQDASAEERMRIARKFAMVFQKHALLDSLSVFDNVAFPLRERTSLSEDEISGRVMRGLTELDVQSAAGKLPAQLSGGMAKRVGIARALVLDPEIIIYDEPTSGLDPVSSRVVDDLIERTRERHFVTSIVITHDMMTAYEVADRVLLLAAGKIAADGDPETIFRTHDDAIAPFALSSGIDLTGLGPRKSRVTADEIRQRWEGAHPLARGRRRSWLERAFKAA